MKKMIIKSENILNRIEKVNYTSINSSDLDNLVENMNIDDYDENNKFSLCKCVVNGIDFYENIPSKNSVIDFTEVEIMDSKNSVRKRNYESIKKKFLDELNKNY